MESFNDDTTPEPFSKPLRKAASQSDFTQSLQKEANVKIISAFESYKMQLFKELDPTD
jgi:hypothetical protein